MKPAEDLPRAPVEARVGPLAYGAWPGTEPALVCLHGIGGNHRAFLGLARALAGRRLIAPDLRGRGTSDPAESEGSTPHAQDVCALVDALGLTRPVLLGHSFGAFVATEAVAAHPGRFGALVLLDGGIWPPWTVPAELLEAALATSLRRLELVFPDLDAYAAYWGTSGLALPATPERRSEMARGLKETPAGLRSVTPADVYRRDMHSVRLDERRNRRFAAITVPVLLVRAPLGLTGDPSTAMVSDDVLAAARPAIPQLEVLDLDGMNHYQLLSGSALEQVAAAVAALLDQA